MKKKETISKINKIFMELKVFTKEGEFQVTVKLQYDAACKIWDARSYVFSDLHLMKVWTDTITEMASEFGVPVSESFSFVTE